MAKFAAMLHGKNIMSTPVARLPGIGSL